MFPNMVTSAAATTHSHGNSAHLLADHVLIVPVWLKTNGTVQLYVHPDYNKFEYVFIDMGIKPVGILLSPQPTSMLNAFIAPHYSKLHVYSALEGKHQASKTVLQHFYSSSLLLLFNKIMATKSENLAVPVFHPLWRLRRNLFSPMHREWDLIPQKVSHPTLVNNRNVQSWAQLADVARSTHSHQLI